MKICEIEQLASSDGENNDGTWSDAIEEVLEQKYPSYYLYVGSTTTNSLYKQLQITQFVIKRGGY